MVDARVEEVAEGIFRFLRSRGAHPHEAMDLAQETMLRALRERAGLRDPAAFRPFCYEIARNLLADTRRRPPRARPLADVEPADSRFDPATDLEARSIRAAVDALPADLRDVLLLYYYDDLTYEEIAAALAVPRPTVQGRLRRAKEELRTRLGPAFADEAEAVPARAAVRRAYGFAPAPLALVEALRAAPAPAPLSPSNGAAAKSAAAATALPVPVAIAAVLLALATGGGLVWILSGRDAGGPRVRARPEGARDGAALLAKESGERAAPAGTDPAPLQDAPPEDRGTSATPTDPADGATALESAREGGTAAFDPDRAPPPYPWPDVLPGPTERRLLEQSVSLNCESEPFANVLKFLEEGGFPVVVDPPLLEEVKAQDARVNLRLRDIRVAHAIALVAAQVDAGVLYETTPRFVRDLPPAIAVARARRAILERSGETSWREQYRAVLASRRISVNFPDIEFREALNFLRDITGLNFGLDVADPQALPHVTANFQDISLEEGLATILAASDRKLRTELRDETIVITDRPARAGPRLADAKVTLALTGATVPVLVRALEAQKVPVLVGLETWESRGSLSLHTAGRPLSEIVREIGRSSPLSAEIVEADLDGASEVLVIRGSTHPVEPSLAREPALGFEGVRAELAELRAHVRKCATARSSARAAKPLDIPRLAEAEATTARALVDVDAYLRHLAAIANAPERLRTIERAEGSIPVTDEERAALERAIADLARLEKGERLRVK